MRCAARIAGPNRCSAGDRRGLQRFRCTVCRRTSNALTGTPLARLKRRDVWFGYARALEDGLSIRKAARRVGVHHTTTFRWRHRWLALPRDRKDTRLVGIVEADETYFLESRKGSREWTRVALGNPNPPPLAKLLPALGLSRPPRRRGGRASKRGLSRQQVPVLIVRDRNGATTDAVLPRFDATTVGAVLGPVLAPGEALLCTDGARVYRAFARATGVTHRPINRRAGQPVRGSVFHVQHVNAYHARLKDWMRRFKGVSTKYLANYLGWRRVLEGAPAGLPPAAWLRLAAGC